MVIAEPLHRSPWAKARWFIIAPHADDETLGVGALVAHVARERLLGGILYLTDGTGSHSPDTTRLSIIRKVEARRALRLLGAKSVDPIWLDWKDAQPHSPDSPIWRRDVSLFVALLCRHNIDAIAVSDRADRHCDHVAAYQLALEATKKAPRSISLFSYHVWSKPDGRGRTIVTPNAIAPGRRRLALRSHRSQTTRLMGQGFRLSPEKVRAMKAYDMLTLRKIGYDQVARR